MLLESAFYKLPELMMSSIQSQGRVEAMVVQYMANGLQMELACRSVPFAYNHVIVERPYPNQRGKGNSFRADLLFDANGTIPSSCWLHLYGFKDKQWLEAKTFFSKKSATPTKTQNLGKIVKDIIRLCLLPEELQGRSRQNGRYILLVFDRHPFKYLAYSKRKWVKTFIEDESGRVKIDLSLEPKSFIKSIVNSDQLSSTLTISFKRFKFEPCQNESSTVYWGYLYRIEAWSITLEGKEVCSTGEVDERWDAEKISELKEVRTIFLSLLSKDET